MRLFSHFHLILKYSVVGKRACSVDVKLARSWHVVMTFLRNRPHCNLEGLEPGQGTHAGHAGFQSLQQWGRWPIRV